MSEQILLKLPVRVGVKKIYDKDGDYTLYYVAMVEGSCKMAAVGTTKEDALDMLKTLVDSRMTPMSPPLHNETEGAVNSSMEFLLDTCQDEPIDSTSILTNIRIDSRFSTLTDTDVRTVARNICILERKLLGDDPECNPDDFLLDRRIGCIVVTLPGDVVMYGDTIKLWFYGSSVKDPARDTSYDFDEMLMVGGIRPTMAAADALPPGTEPASDEDGNLLESLLDMVTSAIRQAATAKGGWYRQVLYKTLENLISAREEELKLEALRHTNPLAGFGGPPEESPESRPYPSQHIKVEDFSLFEDDGEDPHDENEFSAETPKDPVQ